MKKIFENPKLAVERFESENVVTTSRYEQDAAQFTIHGDTQYASQVLEWNY